MSNGSYSNERAPSTGDPEFANDPASGGFFSSDYKKHEDLKSTLDGNKDGLKLEAMKRIIGMIAKGKDASDLFPAVVKNVVSKNIEVKKLVYVYLVRYAEEQQDLALLSISTFQRALKDPNQLIRAGALRVLSSIRVQMIVPIMMLAIKDSVNDMSPYVRKTAAHAIPKLHSLDPEQKDQLIDVIEKLLSDKTTLVVGSAVMAFEEVCPERIDLIHKNYRKLCTLLVDVEEWGQVLIINMLTRYARTQFTDPNKDGLGEEADRPFYEDEDEEEMEGKRDNKPAYMMDQDHRLLLRNTKPLLQSRNTSVVLAVAQLYYYIAPKSEASQVVKALIRLLRNHREVQSIVLSNIATMSTKRKGMFEPFLKSFFVRSSDPTHIKLLKLEILTNLTTETNISIILREFQTYVSSSDKEFVGATVQAIGRCASSIKEVSDTCLNGLVSLLSNRDETVVAESVVVIKKLLQMQPSEHREIIAHMARLVDKISVPMARASILWLLGEYADRVPKIAPDVLRKMAKTFTHEEDIVKLQVLTLATKLYLANSKQTKLLTQYVFNMAKYDMNYDIRDRVRFLRQLIIPQGEKEGVLTKHAKKIVLSLKPAPVLESKFKDRDQYQLGSLSHYINARAYGYHDLPEFPDVAPDPSLRSVDVVITAQEPKINKKKKQVPRKKSFYSESDSSSPVDESENSSESGSESGSSEDGSASTSGASNEASSEESESPNESDSDDHKLRRKGRPETNKKGDKSRVTFETVEHKKKTGGGESGVRWDSGSGGESSESAESSASESAASSSSSTHSDHKFSKQKKVVKDKKPSKEESKTTKQDIDLLLDLDFDPIGSGGPPVAPTSGLNTVMLTPLTTPVTDIKTTTSFISQPTTISSPMFVPTEKRDLLDRITGQGLHVQYRFTRNQNLYSPKMTSVELTFTNHSDKDIANIKVGTQNLGLGMEMHIFPEIEALTASNSFTATIGIDFNETTQPAKFDMCFNESKAGVGIQAPMGEVLQPIAMTEQEFISQQNKLKGMNEHGAMGDLNKSYSEPKAVCQRVHEAANVLQVTNIDPAPNLYRFAGRTLTNKVLVLITLRTLDTQKVTILVNCEKMIVGSMLLKELKAALAS